MDDINIGFIGLGNMGQHMCLALIQNSYNVTAVSYTHLTLPTKA